MFCPVLLCPTLLTTSLASLQALLLTTCSAYWSFVLLASGFGLCTGLWVACETPLIIRTLSFHLLTPAFGLLTAASRGAESGCMCIVSSPYCLSLGLSYNFDSHRDPLCERERTGKKPRHKVSRVRAGRL